MDEKVRRFLATAPKRCAVVAIRFYKAAVSPLLPSCCRFQPTCSEYGLQAFERFGFRKGLVLTAKRVWRCRPGGGSGYDPVPEIM